MFFFIFQGSTDCRTLACLVCVYFRDRRTVEPYIALFVYVTGIEGLSNLTLPCLCMFQGSKDCRTLDCVVCVCFRNRRTVEPFCCLVCLYFRDRRTVEPFHCIVCVYFRDRRTVEPYTARQPGDLSKDGVCRLSITGIISTSF